MSSKSPLLDAVSLLIPGLVAVFILAPALDGWYRADDLLFNPFLDTNQDRVDVAWSRIGNEFVDVSWRAGTMQYRPLVAVAYGALLSLGGGASTVFHAANLVLHLISSTLCAWLCLRLSNGQRIAAVLGGAMFALHPCQGEVVGWVAAINAGLETCLRLSCLACFVGYLSSGRRAAYLGAFVFCVLGLATLETSVVTPLSLIALDLVVRRGALSSLIKRQAPFVLLGLGYVVARFLAISRGSSDALGEAITHYPATVPSKLTALVSPFAAPLAQHTGLWLSVALGTTVLAYAASNRARLAMLGAGTVWILAHFIPSGAFAVWPDLQGIRIVHPVTVSLALLLTVVLWRDRAKSRLAKGALLIQAAWIVSFVPVTRTLLSREAEAAHFLESVQSQLIAYAEDVTPDQPQDAPNGLGVIWNGGVHVLAQRPYADVDRPVVVMNYVFEDRSPKSALRNDAAVWRAMRAATGARNFVSWQPTVGRFERNPQVPGQQDLAVVRNGSSARFDFRGGATSSANFEVVRIRTRADVQRGTLLWNTLLPTKPDLRAVNFADGQQNGDTRTFEVDLSHDVRLLLLSRVGVTGFEVTGVGEDAVLGLEVLPRVGRIEVPLIDGAPMPFGSELGLPRPRGDDVTLVLLGPGYGTSIRLAETGIQVPAAVLAAFTPDLRMSRAKRVYYFFARPGARSTVGWFRATGGSD